MIPEKEELQKRIGKRIAKIRKAKKLTQLQLAELCDKDERGISKLETGGYMPSLLTLLEISAGLGISLSELLEGFEDSGT